MGGGGLRTSNMEQCSAVTKKIPWCRKTSDAVPIDWEGWHLTKAALKEWKALDACSGASSAWALCRA